MTTLLSYFGTIVGGGQNDPHDLLQTITDCTELSGFANDPKIATWVQRAVARLSVYDFDETLEGFEINMTFAIQKMAETFWNEFQEETIKQANSPFRSAQLGSYRFTRFDPRGISSSEEERDQLPAMVLAFVDFYLKRYEEASFTTRIWQEYDLDQDTVREYHDFLDERLSSTALAERYGIF